MVKKILKRLVIILLVFIITFFGIQIYLKNKLKDDIFEINNYGIIIETSNNMEPEIQKDELIIIKKYIHYDLEDIILYENFNNKLLIRRIVQIDEYGFIAKGDNKNMTEPCEEIKKIKGKVIYHSKFLGKIFN